MSRNTFILIGVMAVVGLISALLTYARTEKIAIFKMRGFVEFTALHVFYVAGFGWMMPKLLTM